MNDSTDDNDIDGLIASMEKLLGLEIADDSRASIRAHLDVAFRMAPMIIDYPLGDHAEPAPVFEP